MKWFRGGTATFRVEQLTDLRGQSHNIPRHIAMETSEEAIEGDWKNSAVNVVLYNDEECEDERNDFFFESLEDAMEFCSEIYGVTRSDWFGLGKWQKVTV